MTIFFVIIALSVVLDQITKYLVVLYMSPVDTSIPVIGGVLNLTYITNDGMALGLLENRRWIFMTLTAVTIIAITVYMAVKKPKNRLFVTSLALICGGGVGNMIDRVLRGTVVDFIDFCAFPDIWRWIFNVADICVTVGAGLMILYVILDTVRDSKANKSAAADGASDSDESTEFDNIDESDATSDSGEINDTTTDNIDDNSNGGGNEL